MSVHALIDVKKTSDINGGGRQHTSALPACTMSLMHNHTQSLCLTAHTHFLIHTHTQASVVDMIMIWRVQIKSIGKRCWPCPQDWHLCATDTSIVWKAITSFLTWLQTQPSSVLSRLMHFKWKEMNVWWWEKHGESFSGFVH